MRYAVVIRHLRAEYEYTPGRSRSGRLATLTHDRHDDIDTSSVRIIDSIRTRSEADTEFGGRR